MRLLALPPLTLAVFLVACGSDAESNASASATASQKPPPPAPTPSQTATATASASASPVLPGTAMKDILKDLKSIMVLGKATGPMGAMVSDKKDVAAFVTAIGTDQQLKKAFESKCAMPIRLDFQSNDGKSLGAMGFCDADGPFNTARFDGSGAEMAEVTIKDPAGFKAALKKAGAVK
jgi:hypothetical protein